MHGLEKRRDAAWTSARDCAERSRWSDAAALYRETIELTRTITREAVLQVERFRALANTRWLYEEAAVAVCNGGNPLEAVATLESGRVQVLSEDLERRQMTAMLASVNHPNTARVQAASARLSALEANERRLVCEQRERDRMKLREEMLAARTEYEAARDASGVGSAPIGHTLGYLLV